MDSYGLNSHIMAKSTGPINRDLISFLEGVDGMLGMLASHIPDTEIIHNKRESDGDRDMFPKPWSEGCMMVPMEDQTADKEVVREDTSLREAVHAFMDFHVDVSI
jgi:hypothetical protein